MHDSDYDHFEKVMVDVMTTHAGGREWEDVDFNDNPPNMLKMLDWYIYDYCEKGK